ncbi:MAG: sulfatase-like hydrolase/transferase, partial [Lacipirellulaceae bacterium]
MQTESKLWQEQYDEVRVRSYLTSLMLILLATSLATADQQRPNIVFLLTDDQRADLLGVAGNKYAKTPNLDELAGQGTLFENAFVTTSICMTSRASIMLGQHALRHGINAFNVSLTQDQLQASYFGQLKSAGYQLGFIGKWG